MPDGYGICGRHRVDLSMLFTRKVINWQIIGTQIRLASFGNRCDGRDIVIGAEAVNP